jgi:hypothetical protein
MIPDVPRGAGRRRILSRTTLVALAVSLVLLATASPALAASNPDPSKVGDLTGNLPVAVYLLIPLALLLAFLTAVLLGAKGDPAKSVRRAGGISRALSRAESSEHPPP